MHQASNDADRLRHERPKSSRVSVPVQGPPMASESRGTPTAFPLKHQKKDLVLACDLAQELKVEMPVAKAAAALYEKVCLDV